MGINLIPELALEIIYSDFLFNTRMSVWFPWCMATQSWLRTHEPGPPPLLPPAGNVSSITDGSDSQKATCPVLSALCWLPLTGHWMQNKPSPFPWWRWAFRSTDEVLTGSIPPWVNEVFVCGCVGVCSYVVCPCECRRHRYWVPQSWGRLKWILGIGLRSSGRAESVLTAEPPLQPGKLALNNEDLFPEESQ